jgi:hypothetical protein
MIPLDRYIIVIIIDHDKMIDAASQNGNVAVLSPFFHDQSFQVSTLVANCVAQLDT